MLPYNLDTVFVNKEQVIENINACIVNIDTYINGKRSIKNLKDLYNDIHWVLSYWTGQTYVGIEKEEDIKNAFQLFFTKFYYLINDLRKNGNRLYEKMFSKNLLYQGTVYRYLGSHCETKNGQIKIDYNGVYVSWNKIKDDYYIKSKLLGKKTLLTCEIKDKYFGIDLDKFGVCVGKEKEVVFPTIKDTIVKVEVI